MATLHWQRDIGQSISDAKTTFSSWDACMSKTYCKWPVIIAIVCASLIVFSLLFCLFRCLCCGVECCCGCLSCCNACCPSPRRKQNQGYQQAPAPPTPSPYYNQYQPPQQPPVYASGGMGYRSASTPQTATFDSPSKSYNEDALPAMPSWDNATSRRVETHEEVELDKLDPEKMTSPNTQGFHGTQETGRLQSREQDFAHGGDMGGMSASPYHDYQQHRQVASPSPYPSERPGAASPYAPSYQNPTSPAPSRFGGSNSGYFGAGAPEQYGHGQQKGYEPSIPPSYHSHAPNETVSPVSPVAQPPYPMVPQYQAYGAAARKPVQGSWREI